MVRGTLVLWLLVACANERDARGSINPTIVLPIRTHEAPARGDRTLAIYALSLHAPHAPFERYWRRTPALEAPEQRGYDSFRDYGCVSCHQGIDVGGNLLRPKFGFARNLLPRAVERHAIANELGSAKRHAIANERRSVERRGSSGAAASRSRIGGALTFSIPWLRS